MGMPKRGTRRITVDGVAYRWVARNRPEGVRVVVQSVEPPGAVLVLRSGQNLAATHVLPSRVTAAIRDARSAGWEPLQAGPTFEVATYL